MKIQYNNNDDMWDKFKKTKNKDEKKKILDEMINPRMKEKEEDSNLNLTPREMEMKKQIRKLNSKDAASKVARGEYVNDSDLRELEENDPELLVRAKYMNVERKRIENEVRNARTKKIGKEILASERQGAIGMAISGVTNGDDGTADIGIIRVNAVDKAEENSSEDLSIKDKGEKKVELERARRKRKKINKLV